ncbi:DUF4113 domain-containing protein [Pseudomonas syringae]|uniref:DUF4113 domain-containing protein n=1 Tax=Pseudomonas syringae TaxID=317 RepID=UPI003B3BAC87
MAALDSINGKWGRGTLRTGSVPVTTDWGMRREQMSQSYTTRLGAPQACTRAEACQPRSSRTRRTGRGLLQASHGHRQPICRVLVHKSRALLWPRSQPVRIRALG